VAKLRHSWSSTSVYRFDVFEDRTCCSMEILLTGVDPFFGGFAGVLLFQMRCFKI
jgi:hypothetical protein